MSRKTRRKLFSNFMLFVSFITAAYGIFWLFWILGSLFINGFKYLSPELVYLDPTPPGQEGGGLRPAFVGTPDHYLPCHRNRGSHGHNGWYILCGIRKE
jgi:ABC-type phosphate transport system permease subunit